MAITLVLLFVIVLAADALLIFTPWLMPDAECFAVTVPHGQRAKEPLKGLMQAYAVRMALISVLSALGWPIAFGLVGIDVNTQHGMGLFTLVVTLSVCVPALASFVLMLCYRRRVQAIKAAQGWHVERARSTAFVGDEGFPRPISLLWNLAYIPLMVAMIAFAAANYDRFPDMIPMNVDFNGVVTRSTPKSFGVMLFPALLTAFLGIVFFGTHLGIVRSKKPIDPDAPASSALAYGRFARTQSILMLVGGLALSGLTAVLFYASALGSISMLVVAVAEMVVALAFAAVAIVMSVRLGQSGGRIAAAAPEGSMSRDDDRYWKLGMFYCNGEDPSVFVPQRFGVGWTLNLSNPLGWVAVAGLVVVTVGFCWVMALIMG